MWSNSRLKIFLSLCVPLFFGVACNSEYPSLPRDYPAVSLPEKKYKPFQIDGCDFQMEIPEYSKVGRDSFFFDKKTEHPCWINLEIPALHATIYMNYKDLQSHYTLERLIEDCHKLTFKHAQRASSIRPDLFETENGTVGLIYRVQGNVASPTQFYITDTLKHFVRGSLYFNGIPNADSLKPMVEFLNKDIEHLIQTLVWQ